MKMLSDFCIYETNDPDIYNLAFGFYHVHGNIRMQIDKEILNVFLPHLDFLPPIKKEDISLPFSLLLTGNDLNHGRYVVKDGEDQHWGALGLIIYELGIYT